MLSGLDRYLLAFRRDVQCAASPGLDRYIRLYWDDPAAFGHARDAAWASRRTEPFVTIALAEAEAGALSRKSAFRLVSRLLPVGRFEEAIAWLLDPRFQLTSEPQGLLQLVRTELGLGRLHQAQTAIGQARTRDPALVQDARKLEAAVFGLKAAKSAFQANPSWNHARTLFDTWIEAGSPQAGLNVLMEVMRQGISFDPDERYSFHEALDLVLSLCSPPSVYNLFRTMELLPAYAKRATGLKAACDWLFAQPTDTETWDALDLETTGALLASSAAKAAGAAGRRAPAIVTLGALSLARPKEPHHRLALARFVGQEVLASHPLRMNGDGRRRIFDVFLFNSELRLLKVKLHEMADWVDGFVLVEARQTFTGAPKPLVFEENRNLFAEFASKIVHVVVDEFPPFVRHPWAREFYQRDMGVLGLSGRCGEDDFVIISDTDEIASREAVLGFQGEYATIGMERLRYFLNYREVRPPHALKPHSGLWRARYLQNIGLSYARSALMPDKTTPKLANGGWHFTTIGDATRIVDKLNHSSHQENAGKTTASVDAKLAQIRAGKFEPGWERVELDDRLPAYVRAHRDEFADVLL